MIDVWKTVIRAKTRLGCHGSFLNKVILDCYFVSRFSTMQISKLIGISEAEVWNEVAKNGDRYRKRSNSKIWRAQQE